MTCEKEVELVFRARDTASQDRVITADGKDYADDKCYYICRWLNHSFMPFTKRQINYYQKVKEHYENYKIQR